MQSDVALIDPARLSLVVEQLKLSKTLLAAFKATRRNSDVLYMVRLAVEAFLSGRLRESNIEPLRLVNALALLYHKTNRPDRARELLVQSLQCSGDVGWVSQTLTNIMRLDYYTKSDRLAVSIANLSSYLQVHARELSKESVSEFDEARPGLSILEIQTATMAKYFILSTHLDQRSRRDCLASILEAMRLAPALSKSDVGAIVLHPSYAAIGLALAKVPLLIDQACDSNIRFLSADQIADLALCSTIEH